MTQAKDKKEITNPHANIIVSYLVYNRHCHTNVDVGRNCMKKSKKEEKKGRKKKEGLYYSHSFSTPPLSTPKFVLLNRVLMMYLYKA
jgi:hypothetical protein